MTLLRLAAAAVLLAMAQLAPAVQPAGMAPPSQSGPAAGEPTERGGTVDGVDLGRRSILVDGVPYTVHGPIRIHLTPSRVSTALADLRRGMQIRFTSVKDRSSPQSQVREIWVTGVHVR